MIEKLSNIILIFWSKTSLEINELLIKLIRPLF
jgi:hypothetical protein